MNQYFRNMALLTVIALASSAGTVRAETSIDSIDDDSARVMILEQAAAVDNISIELGKQGVVLSDESAETLRSYSDALKTEAASPMVGARLKNFLKKTGKGLGQAGGFVLKSMSYVGKVGAAIVVVPVMSVGQFAGGLVGGSNPGTALDAASGITAVLTIGVVATPLVFANPAVLVAGVGFGALMVPSAFMCNEDRGISPQNEKFCANMDKIEDILYDAPQEATYGAGAAIHDGVAKVIKMIFHKRG